MFQRAAFGWSEGGHHIIALLAFDLLSTENRTKLSELLTHHPRYAADFVPPRYLADAGEVQRWRVGRAGYWPDVARSQPLFTRPTWHFQLAATLTIGRADKVNLPVTPVGLPSSATLDTQELHIAQAVELCRRVAADLSRTPSDRALAISWLAHLVADAHQPCHAGSLYAEGVFVDGDRGANSIRVKQGQNIHYLWDALLGSRFDAGDVRRRMREISTNRAMMSNGQAAAAQPTGLDPLTWLAESRQFAIQDVYAADVLTPVAEASRGLTGGVPEITLSEAYLQRAGQVAQERVAVAAHRLAAVWRETLER